MKSADKKGIGGIVYRAACELLYPEETIDDNDTEEAQKDKAGEE